MNNPNFQRLLSLKLNYNMAARAEAESSSFDADAIVAASEAELYNSVENIYDDISDFCASDYVASAQIAMAIDW